jgi:hypothetical protein
MRQLIASIAFLGLSVPAGAQEQFERWTATCRSDSYCFATALHEPANGRAPGEFELRIGRWAEETYWELSLEAASDLPPAPAVTIEVDGAPTAFEGATEVARFGSASSYFFMGSGAQEVMDRLMQARTVSVHLDDAINPPLDITFSLEGLTAALIQIDTWQGRLGSERVAEVPPANLVPLDGPTAAALPEGVLAQRDADSQCRPLADLRARDDIVIDTMLDDNGTLFLLPCWYAAYNQGWRGYVEFLEGHYEPVALPELSPDGDWSATMHIVNYSYDPATNELSTSYRGSGSRDCGTAGLYRWKDNQFVLIEFRARACDEAAGDEMGNFPLVYPAN